MQTNRRSFVKASGMAAVLGTTGLAGCNILGGDGGSGGAGDWQYDPSTLGESPNVVFGSMDYGTLYDNRDELPDSMAEDFEVEDSDSPFGPEDIDHVAGVGGGTISQDTETFSMFGSAAVTGDFDRDVMIEDIEDEEGSNRTEDYGNYAMYEVSDVDDTGGFGGVEQQPFEGSGTFGVGDSAVIFGMGMSQGGNAAVNGRDTVEAAIDASTGDAQLLSDTSGPAQDLQSRLGDSMMSLGMEADPELVSLMEDMDGQQGGGMGGSSQFVSGFRAGGLGADINGDTTTFRFVLIYDSADSAERSGIADLVNGLSPQFEEEPEFDEVSAERDGASVTVTITGDTETLAEQGESSGTNFSVAPTSF